jgi:hypothetical protein
MGQQNRIAQSDMIDILEYFLLSAMFTACLVTLSGVEGQQGLGAME